MNLILLSLVLFQLILQAVSKPNARYYCPEERIITSLLIIESFDGVPVDFSYNETTRNNNQLVSSPGCPKSIDGFPWIYYYRQTLPENYWSLGENRCYLAGYQGPCPKGQVIFLQNGSNHGVCGCECLLKNTQIEDCNDKNDDERYQICYSKSIPQGQVYDKFDKRICYNLEEQGPCSSGTVLAQKVTLYPVYKSSVACLPICDINDPNWTSKLSTWDCAVVSNGGFASGAGFATNLIGNDCPPEERFSNTLKKCVKSQPHKNIILG